MFKSFVWLLIISNSVQFTTTIKPINKTTIKTIKLKTEQFGALGLEVDRIIRLEIGRP